MNSDTQTKMFTFMERLWLTAIVLSIICVAYFLITRDNDSALFFVGFFVISGVQYLMRKRQKKRHMHYLQQQQEKSASNPRP